MVDIKPPETCGWCARPSNKPHRPNCPRPGEVFTATDLRNARAEATAAAEQRLSAARLYDALWLLKQSRYGDDDEFPTLPEVRAALEAASPRQGEPVDHR